MQMALRGRDRVGRRRSQSLCPPTIVARSVENSVKVENLVKYREENPIGKTVCKHAANFSVAMDDSK